MISQMNQSVSLASQIKQLKKAIKEGDNNPFLYKTEELIFMKRSLRRLREVMDLTKKAQKGGFGYDV
jgi:hypothetical protein